MKNWTCGNVFWEVEKTKEKLFYYTDNDMGLRDMSQIKAYFQD